MIFSMKINNVNFYLCIFDNTIFIIKQINLPKYQEYFKEHLDSLIFMTSECKENFINICDSKVISIKNQNSKENDQFLNYPNDFH